MYCLLEIVAVARDVIARSFLDRLDWIKVTSTRILMTHHLTVEMPWGSLWSNASTDPHPNVQPQYFCAATFFGPGSGFGNRGYEW